MKPTLKDMVPEFAHLEDDQAIVRSLIAGRREALRERNLEMDFANKMLSERQNALKIMYAMSDFLRESGHWDEWVRWRETEMKK